MRIHCHAGTAKYAGLHMAAGDGVAAQLRGIQDAEPHGTAEDCGIDKRVDAGGASQVDDGAQGVEMLEEQALVDHYGASAWRGRPFDERLGDIRVGRYEDIDIVLASHLHFDHIGGFTTRKADGGLVPRFPNARYIAPAGEWFDATHPHERNRASYLPENFQPLMDAGVLTLVDDGAEVAPGIRYRHSGGHTAHHQVLTIASGGKTAVFAADMYPTSVHLPDPWVMGYDLYPVDTLAFKRAFSREAIERDYLVFFEHDPSMAAGYLREANGRRSVERAL